MGKKGSRLRECVRCRELVRFELWDSETLARNRRIHHWANADGSHHRCNTDDTERQNQHVRDILSEGTCRR